MFKVPTLPPWDAMHPIVVHFPIALLAVAPVMVLAGLLLRRHRTGLLLAAWLMMALGTAGAFVAVSTGEAAEDLAVGTAGSEAALSVVLHEHEELAETTRNIFTGLTLAYGLLLCAGAWMARRRRVADALSSGGAAGGGGGSAGAGQGKPGERRGRGLVLGAHAVFLAAYALGVLVLINTGHLGGRVVHEFGVRAMIGGSGGSGGSDGGGDPAADERR